MARSGHCAGLSRSRRCSTCSPGQCQSGRDARSGLCCARFQGEGACTRAHPDRSRRLGPVKTSGALRRQRSPSCRRPRDAAGRRRTGALDVDRRMPASVRAVLAAEFAALDREQLAMAKREVSTAARRLTRAGWAVEKVVLRGIPLPELLRTASMKRADIIIVGARGAGGLKRLLLGSVAEGTFAHAPMSALIVK